jgi:DNA-binding SARP family transcriptional activator
VGATVVIGVEIPLESARPDRVRGLPSIEVRMLGPLTIRREGVTLALPASRKVRGLLAYLSQSPRAVARSQLCELLGDVPNDPRGELRWSLSKIRSLIDAPDQRRVNTQADAIRLDLADCFVDAIEVAKAAQAIASTDPERLQELAALFAGDFL